MTGKHTPGPWVVAYLDNNGQPVVKAEHVEVATCWHHCVGSLEVEACANARLIAAAPDLLASLTSVLEMLGGDCWLDHHGNCQEHFVESPCRVATARATIAKATGETK